MAKIIIDTKHLDDSVKQQYVNLEGEAITLFPQGDNWKPNYCVFRPDADKTQLPAFLFKLPHQVGGSHGDIRLRFKKGNIILMSLKDFLYLIKDPCFLEDSRVLYSDAAGYRKGCAEHLKKYGAQIIAD